MKRKISCLCKSHFYVKHITSIYPHHECAKLRASHAFVPLLFICLPFLTCLMYLHFFMCLHFMSALHALIFYVPWVFLRALRAFISLRVSIFIRALLTLIFHLPYVPSSFTCLPCLYFLGAYISFMCFCFSYIPSYFLSALICYVL